jgi:hypothetical protein
VCLFAGVGAVVMSALLGLIGGVLLQSQALSELGFFLGYMIGGITGGLFGFKRAALRRELMVILFALALSALLAPAMASQKPQPSIRQKFLFLPAYRECRPAEVTGFALGNQPLDVLLAQVYVRNRSPKIIAALKVGWTVYEYKYGIEVASSACVTEPQAASALESGSSELIVLGSLAPAETINLGTSPLVIPTPKNRTIFVDHPFVTADDVKSLLTEEREKAQKYMIVIYVSEIHYADGTIWTGGK